MSLNPIPWMIAAGGITLIWGVFDLVGMIRRQKATRNAFSRLRNFCASTTIDSRQDFIFADDPVQKKMAVAKDGELHVIGYAEIERVELWEGGTMLNSKEARRSQSAVFFDETDDDDGGMTEREKSFAEGTGAIQVILYTSNSRCSRIKMHCGMTDEKLRKGLATNVPFPDFHKMAEKLFDIISHAIDSEQRRRTLLDELKNAESSQLLQGEPLPGATTTPPPAAISQGVVAELERLAQMKERGLLTEDEFQKAKERVLST